MKGDMDESDLRIYATCPQSKDVPAAEYADRVEAVARWSEDAGCYGILVYTDNGIVDPWLVAQRVSARAATVGPDAGAWASLKTATTSCPRSTSSRSIRNPAASSAASATVSDIARSILGRASRTAV
jgi:hypothetical protein